MRGRRGGEVVDAQQAAVAGQDERLLSSKLEMAMAARTARCVELSGQLTAEYGDLSSVY